MKVGTSKTRTISSHASDRGAEEEYRERYIPHTFHESITPFALNRARMQWTYGCELGKVHGLQRARARDLYLHVIRDKAGARRHHEYSVSKKDRLGESSG